MFLFGLVKGIFALGYLCSTYLHQMQAVVGIPLILGEWLCFCYMYRMGDSVVHCTLSGCKISQLPSCSCCISVSIRPCIHVEVPCTLGISAV